MVTPGGIAVLCMFGYVLTHAGLERWVTRAPKAWRRINALAFLLVFLIPLLNSVQTGRVHIKENTQPFARMPSALTDYMIDNQLRGNILNAYESGGYLIYRLSGQNKVYIDGRAGILYPVEHHLKQLDAISDPDVLLSEVRKYGIDYAVLRFSEQNAILMADTGFELEFVDLQFALFKRNNGVLRNTALLWAKPYCWNEEIAASLKSEWMRATFILPPLSPIFPLLNTAKEFHEAANKVEYLRESRANAFMQDATRKFIAYRALELEQYDFALSQLMRVSRSSVKDYLAQALAFAQLELYDQAERVLDRATRIEWGRLQFQDLVIQQALLKELSQRQPLELFDQAYLDNLNAQVGANSLSAAGKTVTAAEFCSD
jgi:hypothetical protein